MGRGLLAEDGVDVRGHARMEVVLIHNRARAATCARSRTTRQPRFPTTTRNAGQAAQCGDPDRIRLRHRRRICRRGSAPSARESLQPEGMQGLRGDVYPALRSSVVLPWMSIPALASTEATGLDDALVVHSPMRDLPAVVPAHQRPPGDMFKEVSEGPPQLGPKAMVEADRISEAVAVVAHRRRQGRTPCPTCSTEGIVKGSRKPCLTCGAPGRWPKGRCPSCEARVYGGTSLKPRGGSREWRRLRGAVLLLESICRVCRVEQAVDVDHIVARVDGGTDDRDNLMPICARCHKKRHGGRGDIHPPSTTTARRPHSSKATSRPTPRIFIR